MRYRSDVQAAPPSDSETATSGRYLYCVADGGESVSLGPIGIEGHEVYAVPYKDICAVIHDCAAEPYQSKDQEVVKAWVLAHQRVVDAAWERWGTVLPLSFDTIVRSDADIGPGDNLKKWLRSDYETLTRKIEGMKGKAEYGVQVFWNSKIIVQELVKTKGELNRLAEEIKSKPRGLAYIYRQKLENLLRSEIEAEADRCFRECYQRIRKQVDDLRVEKTKRSDGDALMLLNLSCLVFADRVAELGGELESIAKVDGFWVRFTGPWPPYSFVGG